MAKKQQSTAKPDPAVPPGDLLGPRKARALVDLPHHGVKCGQFFEASSALVNQLVDAGQADDKALETDVYGEDIPAHIDLES